MICAVLGGFYGPRIPVAAAAETDAGPAAAETVLNQEMESFSKIYSLVEQNFADPVKPDKAIYKGAIPGMLRTLDPHSNFFDPKDYQALRDEQKGSYFGVGMSVAPRNGKTVVIAPFRDLRRIRPGCAPGTSSSR